MPKDASLLSLSLFRPRSASARGEPRSRGRASPGEKRQPCGRHARRAGAAFSYSPLTRPRRHLPLVSTGKTWREYRSYLFRAFILPIPGRSHPCFMDGVTIPHFTFASICIVLRKDASQVFSQTKINFLSISNAFFEGNSCKNCFLLSYLLQWKAFTTPSHYNYIRLL